ncbi:hypothetical protein RR48_01249 [Papilio machaon]|uniref:Envelope fusion protein n=1 Tax=Papilio machaon TaxID=76193 RepID=A0A0N1IFU5_PAPMA|nr:hypothetical protein RR48_01249 [Papilio machaon]
MSRHNTILIELANNQHKINETLHLILDQNAYRDSSLIKYAKFAQLLDIISENIDDLLAELLRIENTLAFIRASSAHHSMLDITTLKSMLDKLKRVYNKGQILDLELREYYDIIRTGSYYADDRIVIIFKFPIVSLDIYNLYRLSVVPNKHNQALIPSYPYIATSEKYHVYIEAECPKLITWYLYEKDVGTQMRAEGDCIKKLITVQVLENSCRFHNISLTKEAMEKLDDQHFVVCFPHPTRVELFCGKTDYTSLQGSYLTTIPINCYLRTKEFTITNDNDEIKGQPLKIMKIPYDIKDQVAHVKHINLNSINLQGLHDIQEQLTFENPIQLNSLNSDTILYHTTIPFYTLACSAAMIFSPSPTVITNL